MKKKFLAKVVIFLVIATSAQSAQSENEASLYRVEEGVFKLSEGGTIDLTDHHWLLAFQEFSAGAGCAWIAINGQKNCMKTGMRIDFKGSHGINFKVAKDVADRDDCFLDMVNLVSAKGAKTVATFRFHCI